MPPDTQLLYFELSRRQYCRLTNSTSGLMITANSSTRFYDFPQTIPDVPAVLYWLPQTLPASNRRVTSPPAQQLWLFNTLSNSKLGRRPALVSYHVSSEKQLPQLSISRPIVLSQPWAAGTSHVNHMLHDRYDKTQDRNTKPCGKPPQSTTNMWIKIDPCYHPQKCSPGTLASGNNITRLMLIFDGFVWKEALNEHWSKMAIFAYFARFLYLPNFHRQGQIIIL